MAQIMSTLFLIFLLCTVSAAAAAQLQPGYYSKTCPQAENIVKNVMRKAIMREPRSAASVMRFQFHDCFVNGCDGSLLLDATPTMRGEKRALANINSVRSFEVVDEIKAALEQACPGIVSCADIIIMASRDAVVLTGGPSWTVTLGRKDSLTASEKDSSNTIPSPRSNATVLVDLFAKYKITAKDMVALSGSHSIGKARCFSIVHRLYNQSDTGKPDPQMDTAYRAKLQKLCPKGGDGNVTGLLDATAQVFDNQYFKDLVALKGFLNSDQTLHTFPQTRPYVEQFSKDQDAFFNAFVEGMKKLGAQQSGKPGEVRRNCRRVNGK